MNRYDPIQFFLGLGDEGSVKWAGRVPFLFIASRTFSGTGIPTLNHLILELLVLLTGQALSPFTCGHLAIFQLVLWN